MFLLADTGTIHLENKDDLFRILLFASIINMNKLSEYNNWYGDGTFSIGPKIYYQVFTLHYLNN